MCLTCGCGDAHQKMGKNITYEDLREVAVENSKPVDEILRVMTITAAQEQKLLSSLSARIDQQVNAKGFLPRRAFRRFPNGGIPAPKNAPVPPAYQPGPAVPAPTA